MWSLIRCFYLCSRLIVKKCCNIICYGKSYVINRIKELCNKKNDREIALDFSYNNRIFHAKYLFLGNDLYITDTLNVIELKDLDMGVLSRLSELLKI